MKSEPYHLLYFIYDLGIGSVEYPLSNTNLIYQNAEF